MKTALLCTPKYFGTFATIHRLGSLWRLTAWEWGKPVGHVAFDTAIEALFVAMAWGMELAGEGSRRVFETDVILAG